MHQQLHHPCVPFVEPIYGSIIPGARIEIDGSLPCANYNKAFVVELLSGPDHVFHMSFRFHHGEHQIVMNSSIKGKWQQEERVYNPFGPHDFNFRLSIHVQACHFEIHVHNRCIATFTHRFPIHSIQALGVQGDVQIHRVQFNGFPLRSGCGSNGHNWGLQGHAGCGSSPALITPQYGAKSGATEKKDSEDSKLKEGMKLLKNVAKLGLTFIN